VSKPTEFVDLEAARAAKGLRLVVVAGLPSPWSEAAKGIFRTKGIPFVVVRVGPQDREVRQWTRSRNAPVAMYDDEPARTGWADILELSERIGGSRSLVPDGASDRVRMFGLAHEVLGEGGLAWNGRIVTIAEGLATGGVRGFPPFVATYLASRYGFVPERVELAKSRAKEALALLGDQLGAKPYFFGTELTALDVYSAATMNVLEPMPEEQCPMMPPIRHAFESMRGELGEIPRVLLEHRARMYAEHLELPIVT